MDSVTFERLEFPAVLEHLARRAESAAPNQAVLETPPGPTPPPSAAIGTPFRKS